ncbi:phosphonate C-P lyase system protein PhnL [Paenibacillus psychroresistens]|uniref:Phosphonate C-P lyase system protein PhnL n=1 Tax=Paenibacillus psychroresistens TaxID=1778678 RepID=A0A6B8RGU2_9BACL|nr:phosphonate C-P lyase system protein PhnL [Paenibacillus psychroresistens]QGQ94753.1 phosphonate C-P lyase system protein PhnL [Paenibacillus psychroresistens]
MLKVTGLSKLFQLSLSHDMKVNPFQNLSFEIAKGKFMGIAGPSGIGKSSILKCIYRTYLPTSGEIKYDSAFYGPIDLAQATEREISHLRKNEISYVSQFLKVIPRVSAVDIVAEKLLPTGINIEAARLQAEEMLERLRIPRKLIQAFPATFSGGEQQRVNLARAFIVRPRLLILDEPTASLDKETKQSVLELLSEMKAQGTTMIGVFHDWDVMERIADDILDLQAFVLERV